MIYLYSVNNFFQQDSTRDGSGVAGVGDGVAYLITCQTASSLVHPLLRNVLYILNLV